MQSNTNTARDAKELAYLYDLYIAPGWREAFDQIVDEEIELPKAGKFLDAECGTGGHAIDLAIRGGEKTEVVGVDSSHEQVALARGKAEVKKLNRVTFQQGSLNDLDFANGQFDLVIGDASMTAPSPLTEVLAELTRVAKRGAIVALKLTTRGSFDEFFSVYWEALYNLGLLDHAPRLESLITERLTVSDAEQAAIDAGLNHVRGVTRKQRFDFKDADEFLASPLVETFLLDDWLAMLPQDETRRLVRRQLVKVINEERHGMDFDVSIKATLIIGRKQ